MKSKNTLLTILKDYGIITLSCLLYAFTFNCFFQANNLAMGGFTGIAQVLNRLIPALPVGITVFVMNVPLMIISAKKQGWKLLLATVYAVFVSSLMIDGINMFITFPATDPLVASIYGGILLGISLGLMMRKGATTASTKLAARLLKYGIRKLSIGKLCLGVDAAVICIYALIVNSLNTALYSIIAMYISSLAMDMVVYGAINAKLALIVSDRIDEITEKLTEVGLGAAILDSGKDKWVLVCAARPGKIGAIKAAVSSVDPENASIIVCNAKEVFGEYGADSL